MKISKKILAIVLSIIISSVLIPAAFAGNVKGDVNGDSAVNSVDALKILQYVTGTSVADFDEDAADVNNDSKINSSDALEVLRICVGLVVPTNPTEPADEHLSYSKAQIVAYYNQALKDSYAADKLTISDKTSVSVTIDTLKPSIAKSIANNLIEKYAVPTSNSMSFTKGVASDGTTAEKFLVPTALENTGAANAKITKTSSGYKVVITIVDEKINYDEVTKYNRQGSLPLDYDVSFLSDFGATVNSATLDYTGTVITADIGTDGKVTSLNHTMPLKVEGSAKYMGLNISGTGHGQYTLDATFTY